MPEAAQLLLRATLIGVGATVVMDAWSVVHRHVLGMRALDYGLVGRWIVHLPRGRFRHEPITATPPVRGERPLGWAAHYATGVGLALLLVSVWGVGWAVRPTILPALIVGIGSVVLPFFVLQPALGLGIASSRAPNPAAARLKSLATHFVFALGLYVSGWAMAGLWFRG